MKVRHAAALLLPVAAVALDGRAETDTTFVYFGTYTGPKTGSQGIYVSSFDAATGRLGEPKLAAESENLSFLVLHPTRPLLFCGERSLEFPGARARAR